MQSDFRLNVSFYLRVYIFITEIFFLQKTIIFIGVKMIFVSKLKVQLSCFVVQLPPLLAANLSNLLLMNHTHDISITLRTYFLSEPLYITILHILEGNIKSKDTNLKKFPPSKPSKNTFLKKSLQFSIYKNKYLKIYISVTLNKSKRI